MKVSKLKMVLHGVIPAMGFVIFSTACNDNTGTANNSTKASSENATDTTVNTPSAIATITVKAAKKGKATGSLKADDATVKIQKDNMGYYNRTEKAPVYNGSIKDYINSHIEYPEDAINNNIEGTVYVQFGVDENGNVSHVSTVGKKIGYGLEDEAVKVVSNMPKWTPGQVKGKKVKTWRTLPITYKIES